MTVCYLAAAFSLKAGHEPQLKRHILEWCQQR